MSLNERETRLLVGLGVLLVMGNAVRFLAARRPAWTPGVLAGEREVRSDPGAEHERFGTRAELDSLFEGGRLDVNAAGPEHLVLLPGIGPSLAERVVEVRRRRGAFSTLEELLEVKGIGPKTLERLRSHATVR